MTVIGIGTFLFHATLQKWGQLVDEVPMVIASLLIFYFLMTADPNTTEKKRNLVGAFTLSITIFLILLMIFYKKNPQLFLIPFSVFIIYGYYLE
jgi:hypothetical protein